MSKLVLAPGKLYKLNIGASLCLYRRDMQTHNFTFNDDDPLIRIPEHSLVMFVKTSENTTNLLLIHNDIVGWTCFFPTEYSLIFEEVAEEPGVKDKVIP